jgi:uncharacterized protein (DUF1684 family)
VSVHPASSPLAPAALDGLGLQDWKRSVTEMYAAARAEADPAPAWNRWRARRDELFATHPHTPLPNEHRAGFRGLRYFDYDPALRVAADVEPVEPRRHEIATSAGTAYAFRAFALATFVVGGDEGSLELYWLEGYGGGLFLPFGDKTNGAATYGGGRYLLDTIKGADLGTEDGRLVLDFNFAYNPSCAYDPRWVCPLAPPPNRLPFAVEAGERAPEAAE